MWVYEVTEFRGISQQYFIKWYGEWYFTWKVNNILGRSCSYEVYVGHKLPWSQGAHIPTTCMQNVNPKQIQYVYLLLHKVFSFVPLCFTLQIILEFITYIIVVPISSLFQKLYSLFSCNIRNIKVHFSCATELCVEQRTLLF